MNILATMSSSDLATVHDNDSWRLEGSVNKVSNSPLNPCELGDTEIQIRKVLIIVTSPFWRVSEKRIIYDCYWWSSPKD